MDTLRRRIPFKLEGDSEEIYDNVVLDEQQQEEIIDRLRKENDVVNWRYSIALKIVVALSFISQLVSFTNNPLLAIYPIRGPEPSIPLPGVFTILSLFIHLNLALLFSSGKIRPLPYQLLYTLSAVAPTLSLFLQKPWQITVWWCITPLMVYLNQTVMDAFQQSIQGIADLEQMKYTAPGA
ncbi:hypothetical protein M413DRAFT_26388 [Hebeloma cylindrosporum]|uniref:Uncharacterized protein n=1 Tax=Hebeloma cylindrosporum TaxID=76867 RepID=A0A0C3CGD8_HEBCY|nr:hypothetical protein M413DRAFT_26388 [Hebeloma cylindrosporum h7]